MSKKILLLFILIIFCLSGCQLQDEISEVDEQNDVCQPGLIEIEGYGDPGRRLANCFVQYPGEPSREDKSYYIVEDICGQFTEQFMENLLGQEIIKIEPPEIFSLYNCSYYFNEQDYLLLSLEYLSADKQKEGQTIMGRTVAADQRIKMDHFIVWQADGLINEIYLILNPNKFISLNRSTGKFLVNEQFLQLAIKLAEAIQDYK